MIESLTSVGAMPALEATMRFAAQRQQILAHNIANADTPDFIPLDVDPAEFQRVLGEAIDRRRASETRGASGELNLTGSGQVKSDGRGGLTVTPGTDSRNVLFHDRNNRDLERMMQALAENTVVFRQASELMKQQVNLIRGAIAERV